MYIGRQIKSLLETALVTGQDQWINIMETREKINEYKNSQKEFSVEELVSMVKLGDSEVVEKGQKINALRFKLYFEPASRDAIFKEMEMIFKGQVMVHTRKTANGKFIIIEMSNM